MAVALQTNTLEIQGIVVHDIPKHLKGDSEITPNFSEIESVLNPGLRLFFKDKVVQALSSDKLLRVCFDDDSESPIAWLSKEILSSENRDFVEYSKRLGQHLFNCQTGSNPAGILVVIRGEMNDNPVILIMKLDKENGAQLQLDEQTHSFSIQEVQNLMLTQKTKIQKLAMFILREDFEASFDGYLVDNQIDLKLKSEVSTWFMSRYLGCLPFADPQITTKAFFNFTRAYIRTIPDEIEKTKYFQDLNSYLQKNANVISPREFAEDYLLTSERKNEYKEYLKSKNFSFTSSFRKDISQINRQIRKITLEFMNGISIVGNKGTIGDKVKLEKLDNGMTRAEIVSRIKNIN